MDKGCILVPTIFFFFFFFFFFSFFFAGENDLGEYEFFRHCINTLPFQSIYVPILGNCLFSRHYITSTPPFQSPA